MPSFEWDEEKARANLAKHGVSFAAALAVFADPDHVDFDVSRPIDGELRRKAVGRVETRLWTLVYTERGQARRVISARRSNRSEAQRYADH